MNQHVMKSAKGISEMSNDATEKTELGSGFNVFRILVPVEAGLRWDIRTISKESKASIRLFDGSPGVSESLVIISAKATPNAVLPPAVDGLLRIHKLIVQETYSTSYVNSMFTRLLVPAGQASSLIGKEGALIKSMQKASNYFIVVLDKLPFVALNDDKVVEIQGQPDGVHKAVELIGMHLKQFVVGCSVLPLFEKPITKKREPVYQQPPARNNQLIPLPHRKGCKPPAVIKTLTLKPIPFSMTPAVVQSRLEHLAMIEGIQSSLDVNQNVLRLEFFSRKAAEGIKHYFDYIEKNVFSFTWNGYNLKNQLKSPKLDVSYAESPRDSPAPEGWNPHPWVNPCVPWQAGQYTQDTSRQWC